MSVAVSVVIPAYNSSLWIAETLESVLAQDFDDFEVIVVDDGSTDNTAEVVSQFPRVQYLFKPNGGQASARNMGIHAAKGQYIAFQDSDDLWETQKLRLQMEFLRKTNLAWVYSDGYGFDHTTRKILFTFEKLSHLYEGDVLQPLLIENCILSITPIVKRDVFENVGYFDESMLLRKREDWDMWLRIAARYPIGLIREPLAWYRIHVTSGTGGEDQAITFVSQLAVVERAIEREPKRLSHLRNQAIVHICFRVGRRLATRGNLTMARKLFARAIRLYPWEVRSYVYWLGCLIGGRLLNQAILLRRKLHR